MPIYRLCLPQKTIAPRIAIACAGFFNVTGLATDASGNLYVVSPGYNQGSFGRGLVYKVDADGRSLPLTTAPLLGLYGLAADSTANVYASTTVFQHTTRTSHAKIYKIAAGSRTPSAIVSHVSYAYGLAADAAGNVYAAAGNRVIEVDAGGRIVRSIGGVSPNAVAVDASGNLYITEGYNGAARIAKNGTITRLPGKYANPNGIAVDASGNVFVGDEGSKSVFEIASGGQVRTIASRLTLAAGLATGPDASVYIGEREDVRRIAPNGTVSYAGPMLNFPSAIASDGDGNLYVGLPSLQSIVKIVPGASFTTVASGVRLHYPGGIAVHREAVYVAGGSGGWVQIVAKNGSVRTIHKGLSAPSAIAVGARGNAYVADGQYVKKIDPSGRISKVFTVGNPTVEAYGVALDARENVYVAVGSNNEDCDGGLYRVGRFGGVTQIDTGYVSCLYSVASDANGTLYAFSQRGGIVLEIRRGRKPKVLASRIGYAGTLALDGRGHLYVALPQLNAIYRISL